MTKRNYFPTRIQKNMHIFNEIIKKGGIPYLIGGTIRDLLPNKILKIQEKI